MASLGQRDQRLSIAGLEDDARVDVRETASAVEELPRAVRLPEQQNTLPVEVVDVDRRSSRQRMPWSHGGEDAERERQQQSP